MMMRLAVGWMTMVLLLFASILVPFFLFEDVAARGVVQVLAAPWGHAALGGSIAAALALDVLLPVPSSVLGMAAGALLGSWLGTGIVWAGMTLGCGLGYWIGATGGTALVRRCLGPGELTRTRNVGRGIGPAALVLTRAVPILAEASVIMAGTARLPLSTFLPVVALSNLGIAAAYAVLGAWALSLDSVLLGFGGAILLPALAWVLWRLIRTSPGGAAS